MSITHHITREVRSCHEAPAPGRAGRQQPGVCGGLLLGMMILTLVRTSEALAGDAAKPDPIPITGPVPLAASWVRIPLDYQAPDATVGKTFPTQDFRPRGRSMLEHSPAGGLLDPPLISDTSVWQRLSEYRTHDRVRVLTLWETGGSSVSLQAGKKGDPSLQWTSHLMSHGGSAHGLLDELFTKPLGALTHGPHIAPHAPSAEPAGKPEKILDGISIP